MFSGIGLNLSPQVEQQDSGLNRMLLKSFKAVAGRDNEIDSDELRTILNTAFQRGLFVHV